MGQEAGQYLGIGGCVALRAGLNVTLAEGRLEVTLEAIHVTLLNEKGCEMKKQPVARSIVAGAGLTGVLAAATDSKAVQKQIITVVAFGDSITAATHQVPDARWPEMLRRALQDSFPECVMKVINAGVGGNTSRQGLRRIDQDVLKHAPDFVLVEFGGNDATPETARHVSFEEFTNNLFQIRTKVAERNNGRVIMLTFSPIVDEWLSSYKYELYRRNGGGDAYHEHYRKLTRQFAQEHGIPLADIDKALRVEMSQHNKSEYILSDGVHLTVQGNKVVADVVLGVLRSEIGKFLNQRASTNKPAVDVALGRP
jgi:lysophospholipase L1-like esterase